MKAVLLSIALVALVPRLRASLWDDETLAAEVHGLPAPVAVIAGRFERNPGPWYVMRLSRAVLAIRANPKDLAAYDAAGVACDRLGQNDEAIAWMERKNFQMETMERSGVRTSADLREHHYRCLANLGTFWFHRWQRSGADRTRIDEVKVARDLIAKAIALSAGMEFERERYELRTLERIVVPPRSRQGELPPLLDLNDPTNRTGAAVRGLEGLIVWGNDVEDLDLWNTFAQLWERITPRCALAQLARLRCHELIDAGQRSLLPDAPTEARALRRAIDRAATLSVLARRETPEEADQRTRDAYRALRAEAEAWQSARTSFVAARLEQGYHSDTDPGFWTGYHEASAPTVALAEARTPPASPRGWAWTRRQAFLIAFVAGASLSALAAWAAVRMTRHGSMGGLTARSGG